MTTITHRQLLDALNMEPEDLDTFTGYDDPDFEGWVYSVAEALHTIDEEFLFDFTCNSSREIDGGVVSTYVADFVYVARHVELKRLTDDREAVGEYAVQAIAGALLDTYEDLNIFMAKHKLERRKW